MYMYKHVYWMSQLVITSKVQTLGHVTHVWCVSTDCLLLVDAGRWVWA